MSQHVLPRRAGHADRLLVGLFCLWIALPGMGFLLQGTAAGIAEVQRRAPAPFPTLDCKQKYGIWLPRSRSIADWPAGFEAWFNDRWGFRRNLTQAYSAARLAGVIPTVIDQLRSGTQQGSPVVVGQAGWLYYSAHGALQMYQGTHLFSAEELSQWQQTIAARERWLAERGIRYLVVVAPDKPTIYPENLPRSIIKRSHLSRVEQWLTTLKKLPGLEVLDLREPLLQAKHIHPTYYQTDSHWNEFGGYIAYRELAGKLRNWYPDLQPLDFDALVIREQEIGARGDLARMLDTPFALRDSEVTVRPHRPATARVTLGRHQHQRSRKSTGPDAALPSAVVIHDSYFTAIMPLLNEHFSEIRYVAYSDFPAEIIDEVRPAVVIQELVERSLQTIRPVNPVSMQAGPVENIADLPTRGSGGR